MIQGNQDVRGVNRDLAGALCLNQGAFEHAFKSGGVIRSVLDVVGQHFQVLGHKLFEITLEPREIATTVAQHVISLAIINEGVEEMLQGQIFVAAFHGLMCGPINSLL